MTADHTNEKMSRKTNKSSVPKLHFVALGFGLLGLVVSAGGLWLWDELRDSLPELEGELAVAGLEEPVQIERDALGVPTIRAAHRRDVAFATGFLHAQDRFFQMDLSRRQAAGELAALFGRAAVGRDSLNRRHRLRQVATEALASLPDDQRLVVDAYTDGVNAGLANLESEPFEYLALRTDPAPWKPEDSLLTILAMFLELQDDDGSLERSRHLLHATLPEPLAAFLTPVGSSWDALLTGDPLPPLAIPTPEALAPGDAGDAGDAEDEAEEAEVLERAAEFLGTVTGAEIIAGSNAVAVAGSRTAHGHALVGNDMHLGLSLPVIWYRAIFEWPTEDGAGVHRVVGATLPGAPPMVIGSNGQVAWGFANSYIDVSDVVLFTKDPAVEGRYVVAGGGSQEYERHRERIEVRGGRPVEMEAVWTRWGPVLGEDHLGNPWSLRWVAHEPSAVDFSFLGMETATGVDDALDIARGSGMPHLAIVLGDASGRIGWTYTGKIPRRVGFSGRLPTFGDAMAQHWDGWLDEAEVPSGVDPESGILWAGNNRLVDGEMLARVGDGGYALGARATQLRDRLAALETATVGDLFALQLDDRAFFFDRWRDLLLDTLDEEALAADGRRRELSEVVAAWDGHASIASPGFRILRGFRLLLLLDLFNGLTVPTREVDAQFSYLGEVGRQGEEPLWRLLEERPAHFLDERYETWDDLLLAAVDRYLDRQLVGGASLESQTWGQFNTVRLSHPLSSALPWLAGRLDTPPVELPGGPFMPRFQTPEIGASQRLVVAPGREEEGYFHMPGGQSGHPFSPHYRDSHPAWVAGEPSALLPGPTTHLLRLAPAD